MKVTGSTSGDLIFQEFLGVKPEKHKLVGSPKRIKVVNDSTFGDSKWDEKKVHQTIWHEYPRV